MQSSNALQQLLNSPHRVQYGTDAGHIKIDRDFLYAALVCAGTETRTLDAPQRAGLHCTVGLTTYVASGVTVTVVDSAGATTGTTQFTGAGQWAAYRSIETSLGVFAWACIGTYGTTNTVPTATTNTTATAVTYAGATTANSIIFPTNLAAGLYIQDSASVKFATLDSTTGSPVLNLPQNTTIAAGKALLLAAGAGYIEIDAATSGGLKLLPAATTGYLITVTTAAQTTGTTTLTIPNFANVADTFAFVTLAQTLVNKTLTAPVINGATSASGNFDLSGSTGTFKTSTGTNTWGGNTACKPGASVTAAGADQAGATALNEGDQVLVTGVTGQTGYGVKFPSASFAGKRVLVQNITAFACKLYPFGTEDIGGGASTAVTLAASTAVVVAFSAAGVGRVWTVGAQVTS